MTAITSGSAGVIFDEAGEAWPAHPAQRARLGNAANRADLIANAIRNLGFVHVEPVSDVLLVRFEPSVVRPLAAIAACYEISAHAAKRLVISYPGTAGQPDRCEVFSNPSDGLRRLDDAAARAPQSARSPLLETLPRKSRAWQAACDTPESSRKAAPVMRDRAPLRTSRAGDRSVRLARPVAAIASDDEWLGQLLGFWGNARGGRRLPSNESLDSLELVNFARGRAHLVDTASSNPAGYRFRLWGAVNSYGGGFANRTLGEMPAGLMRDEAMEDYRRVVAAAVPSYDLISMVEKKVSYSYARLLLPLAQDGRRVDRLIVLINERHLPEIENS